MEQPHPPPADGSIVDFARKVFAGALIVAVLLAVWEIAPVLVLGFGGVVVGVVLRTMAEPVQRTLRVSDHVALLIVTLGLLGLAIAFFTVFGALAIDQFTALLEEIPGAVASGRKWLQSYTEGRWFLALIGNTGAPSGETLLQALPLAGGVVGAMGEALLVLLTGIYLAADPNTYVRGVVRLFPPHRRLRVNHIMHAMAEALQRWLMGMALDMLFRRHRHWRGAVDGRRAAAFCARHPDRDIGVRALYRADHRDRARPAARAQRQPHPRLLCRHRLRGGADHRGNVTQPLLQRWAVSLSPVLNLLAIVAFGVIFGVWGAVLATPMAVALTVLVRMAYVEDMLEAGHKPHSGPAPG